VRNQRIPVAKMLNNSNTLLPYMSATYTTRCVQLHMNTQDEGCAALSLIYRLRVLVGQSATATVGA